MRSLWEAIQYLFVEIIFIPWDFFRELELSSWFGANIINWIFMIICTVATVYWIKQLRLHEESGEENQDTTAHSFLK